MEFEIKRGRYPGVWRIRPVNDAWSESELEVFRGIEPEAGEILSSLLGWFNPAASEPDALLDTINQAIATITGRLDADTNLIAELGDGATCADAKVALGDILMLSAWFLASAFESLGKGSIGKASRAFGRATYYFGTFSALLSVLKHEIEEPPKGPTHALSFREDQQLKSGFQAFCRAVKASGADVKRLDDLLNVEGYDPRITSIQPRTLKKWASNEGITFKAGRPKKCV
jgi:hypothetical protein